MRRIVLAVTAVTLSVYATENVFAQDILHAIYSTKPIANWTGTYVGANFGYGRGKTDESGDIPTLASGTARPEGGLAGAQFGGIYQTGIAVFGFEGDIQASWQKGSFVSTGTFGGAPFVLNGTNRLPWFGTTRARLGIVSDRFLVYGTGGFAFGEFHNDEVVTGALTGTANFTTFRPGWAAGGGIEAMLGQNWTLRAEYLHIDLGSFTQGFAVTVGGVTTNSNSGFRITNDI